ncbi:MAG: MaoC family dehydratase N-terminal domain-containing protein [Chloroflexota bacterium]
MPILTEEMKRKAIGLANTPVTIEMEKGMIRRFVEAVGEANPKYLGDDMVAPPGLFHTLMLVGPRPELPFELPVKRILDGGGEWEYFVPARPGDVLTVTTGIADVIERESGGSSMVLLVRETTWTNQRGKLVARACGITIIR